MELFQVVDANGQALRGQGRKAKHFYQRECDAKGVATQYNKITVIRDGEGVQLKGAPFTVKAYKVVEA